MKLLIVDDNNTNRKILNDILTNWGVTHSETADAASALKEMQRAVNTGQPYNIVLTDAQMPIMDGFELSERIKTNPLLTNTVIIMLTSMGLRGDVVRCRKLGHAGYLVKPVKQYELFDAIMLILSGRVQEERCRRKMNILLAEDNFINQKMAVTILEKHGHRITVAENGRQALDLLGAEKFDLVLMDVQMPVMDGLTATSIIRQKEQSSKDHIAIIAMTAHAMKGDRDKCIEVGMDDYISKPIEPHKLFSLLDKWNIHRELSTKL